MVLVQSNCSNLVGETAHRRVKMEKGINKTWTPQQEEYWAGRLNQCHTFAERHLTTILHNLFKYDWRTKQAKKANAQARLQFIVATDAELEELAKLEAGIYLETDPEQVAKRLEVLKGKRDEFREKGIKRSDLECR